MVTAFAPGRITLMGDHTDYCGGRSLAMAIQLGTTAVFSADDSDTLRFSSSEPVLDVTLPLLGSDHDHSGSLSEALLAGLLAERTGYCSGGTVSLSTTLPIGVGLSSSASLLIAAAMSVGFPEDVMTLAKDCQRAEAHAGASVGLLDQLTILMGQEHHALRLDFADHSTTLVDMTNPWIVTALHTGVTRSLVTSAYAQRQQECAQAAELIGPLASASDADIRSLSDATLRRRARHVATESARVDRFISALADQDLAHAGRLMNESYASLSKDFDVSLPEIDTLASSLASLPGVAGVRMSGGGFGGCLVVLSEAALDLSRFGDSWSVSPSQGARLLASA